MDNDDDDDIRMFVIGDIKFFSGFDVVSDIEWESIKFKLDGTIWKMNFIEGIFIICMSVPSDIEVVFFKIMLSSISDRMKIMFS